MSGGRDVVNGRRARRPSSRRRSNSSRSRTSRAFWRANDHRARRPLKRRSASFIFAHGMTRQVFGGRATEVGALLVSYFLPRFNATSQPFTSSATQTAFVGDCGGSLLAIDGRLRRIIVLAPPGAAYAARRHRQPAYLLERGLIATFVVLSL